MKTMLVMSDDALRRAFIHLLAQIMRRRNSCAQKASEAGLKGDAGQEKSVWKPGWPDCRARSESKDRH